MTEILAARSPEALHKAVLLLQQGEIVALPTDTVYGLGALAFDATAAAKIYQAKDRPADKPLPVFVPTIDDLGCVCDDVPAKVYDLLTAHWPGALTVVFSASQKLPGTVTNHGSTVAVRIPDHPVVAHLLALLKQPLAVTSANRSNWPNAQTALEVKAQLEGRIPLVLDDGPTPSNVASTIIDVTQMPPKVLRQGAVSVADFILAYQSS